MRRIFTVGVVVVAGLVTSLVASPAQAGTELITNGNFETTTLTRSQQFNGTQVTGWTNAATSGYTGYGYNFLINAGTADTTGFYSLGGNHDYLWGPGGGTSSANYSNNGLTATSPTLNGVTGGNYIMADGDSGFRGAISQTVNNLVVGTQYALTFYWAAAQFSGRTGDTTEAWQVTFGNSVSTTAVLNNPSMGFQPWRQALMYFTATSTSQVLSFLSVGTPSGLPPVALLDNVSLQAAVPEPATVGLMLAGLAGLTAVGFKRRGKARTGAAA